ncbi:MAG: dipeptidase [Clostridia bacterium]|nr:dipeptidase [Clostridia bacterium]
MIICDTHCDTLYMRALQPDRVPCVTMEAMKRGGMSLQTCTLFAGTKGVSDHPYDKAMAEYAAFERLRDTQGWTRVDSPLEAKDGEVRILLSIEGGEIFEGSVERVQEFYDRGIRMAALTWNNENEIGYPAKGGSDQGIKPRGWEILKTMAELKMAADTSHLNEAGFWDLIDRHSQPPMASHSCAKALCPHFRNLTDEQIRAMVKRGGWIGVNFYPAFLSGKGKASVRDIADHIDHMCQLGAQKHVGFGSDFDGIECTPVDCQSPADVPAILEELRRRGYDEEAVEDIAGRNFLNYYRRLGW